MLRRVYQAHDGGAKALRHKRFEELGLEGGTQFGARFQLADCAQSCSATRSDALVTLDVTANDPMVIECCAFTSFNLCSL